MQVNDSLRRKTVSFVRVFVLAILASLFSSGCVSLSDPEASQIHEQDVIATLQVDGGTAGQTFISRRTGLNSLTIWLGSDQASASGSLKVELFYSPAETIPLYQSSLSTSGISAKKAVHINFPARDDPPGQAYYLRLQAVGKSLQIFGRAEDIYPLGNFFVNEVPFQADLAFRTTYNYRLSGYLQDLESWARSAWLLIPLGLLLLVPGWLLLELLGGLGCSDLGEKIALIVGTSLAFIPVLMLWTSTLKLPWSPLALWCGLVIMVVILAMVYFLRIWKYRNSFPLSPTPYPLRDRWKLAGTSYTLALFAIFLFTLTIRLIMVRDYATPTWVDSVHHGMITRLILDKGGFPATYAPYVNIPATEYHPGFHSLLAAFIWLSGLGIDRAMLILGQVLNALAIFSSYLFAVTLLSDRRAGLIAAALTGFFTPMPAYYASWGRYTHLAGMLVLPVFFVCFKKLLDHYSTSSGSVPKEQHKWEEGKQKIKSIAILAVVAGGFFLIHYRIAAFAILLTLIFLVFQSSISLRFLVYKFGTAFLAALCTILLILPWFLPTLTQTLLPKMVMPASRPPLFSGFAWQYLTAGLGAYVLVAALLGLVLGISFRKQFAFLIMLWMVMLFVLSNLSALGLPGGSFVNQTAVEISLYLPLSVLGGYFLSQISRGAEKLLPEGWKIYFKWALASLAVVFILIGARRIIPILNSVTVLSRQPDLPALSWIKTNLPANETIAINPFLWGYGIYAGSDGGYWITPLTGHPTMPPPVLYGLSNPETVDLTNQICVQIISQGKNASGLWDVLHQNRIRYVYLGARGGVISPQALHESNKFHLLYQKNGTWLFEVSQIP